jgi:hypothetical protein
MHSHLTSNICKFAAEPCNNKETAVRKGKTKNNTVLQTNTDTFFLPLIILTEQSSTALSIKQTHVPYLTPFSTGNASCAVRSSISMGESFKTLGHITTRPRLGATVCKQQTKKREQMNKNDNGCDGNNDSQFLVSRVNIVETR